jgi:hypothetical protein
MVKGSTESGTEKIWMHLVTNGRIGFNYICHEYDFKVSSLAMSRRRCCRKDCRNCVLKKRLSLNCRGKRELFLLVWEA